MFRIVQLAKLPAKSFTSRAREMASDVLRVTKQAMGHTHGLFRLAGVLVRDSVV